MPTYAFECVDTGEPVDVYLEFSECPEYGEVIEHEGRRLRHVVALPQTPVSVKQHRRFVSWSLPPVVDFDGELTGNWDPDKVDYDRRPESPSFGQPVIQSTSDIANIEKQSKGEWQYGR